VPPPPLPEPSHWVTEVVSSLEDEVDVVQVGGALAAPWHCSTVTVELAVPVATSRLLVTVTAQATDSPPTLSVPLHWLMAATAAAAVDEAGVTAPALTFSGPERSRGLKACVAVEETALGARARAECEAAAEAAVAVAEAIIATGPPDGSTVADRPDVVDTAGLEIPEMGAAVVGEIGADDAVVGFGPEAGAPDTSGAGAGVGATVGSGVGAVVAPASLGATGVRVPVEVPAVFVPVDGFTEGAHGEAVEGEPANVPLGAAFATGGAVAVSGAGETGAAGLATDPSANAAPGDTSNIRVRIAMVVAATMPTRVGRHVGPIV